MITVSSFDGEDDRRDDRRDVIGVAGMDSLTPHRLLKLITVLISLLSTQYRRASPYCFSSVKNRVEQPTTTTNVSSKEEIRWSNEYRSDAQKLGCRALPHDERWRWWNQSGLPYLWQIHARMNWYIVHWYLVYFTGKVHWYNSVYFKLYNPLW